MQGNHFTYTIHIPGTLAANLDIRFALPFSCSLTHVSAVATNNSDAALTIGTSADADGILTSTVIGDSGAPATFRRAAFNGALVPEPGRILPHLRAGDIFVAALDYDGDAGTPAANVTLAFCFSEG